MSQTRTSKETEKALAKLPEFHRFNYNTDKDLLQRRIANFIEETQANLQRNRAAECAHNNPGMISEIAFIF